MPSENIETLASDAFWPQETYVISKTSNHPVGV